ncbi:hypothetical protein HUJ04_006911 [Dendroctonus ponderosae]|nr:hypothetical protein HUJ04_006911 [Dendroctonus ponderosae]
MDPSNKSSHLNIIKTWLSKQNHLPQNISEVLLNRFLHTCNYSIEQTKNLIELFYTLRSQAPEIFSDRDPASPEILEIFENLPNYFIEYTGLEFFTRFRMQMQTCETLLHLIMNYLKSQTERNRAISPASKFLLSLRFYATRNMLISVGDFVGVSKTFACTIARQVSETTARLRPRNMRFPENIATKSKVKENFYRVPRFPLID